MVRKFGRSGSPSSKRRFSLLFTITRMVNTRVRITQTMRAVRGTGLMRLATMEAPDVRGREAAVADAAAEGGEAARLLGDVLGVQVAELALVDDGDAELAGLG